MYKSGQISEYNTPNDLIMKWMMKVVRGAFQGGSGPSRSFFNAFEENAPFPLSSHHREMAFFDN